MKTDVIINIATTKALEFFERIKEEESKNIPFYACYSNGEYVIIKRSWRSNLYEIKFDLIKNRWHSISYYIGDEPGDNYFNELGFYKSIRLTTLEL